MNSANVITESTAGMTEYEYWVNEYFRGVELNDHRMTQNALWEIEFMQETIVELAIIDLYNERINNKR